jgi:hypothetical protein
MLLVITHCPKQKPAGERLTSQPMARAITYLAVDRRRSSIWCFRNAPDGQNKCRERARFYLRRKREQTTPRRCMSRAQAGITNNTPPPAARGVVVRSRFSADSTLKIGRWGMRRVGVTVSTEVPRSNCVCCLKKWPCQRLQSKIIIIIECAFECRGSMRVKMQEPGTLARSAHFGRR